MAPRQRTGIATMDADLAPLLSECLFMARNGHATLLRDVRFQGAGPKRKNCTRIELFRF
jgi:hypothetical protein